jgi:hypothetical protein
MVRVSHKCRPATGHSLASSPSIGPDGGPGATAPIRTSVSLTTQAPGFFCRRFNPIRATEQIALEFPMGMAVYLYVRRPALLLGEGHMGNIGGKSKEKQGSREQAEGIRDPEQERSDCAKQSQFGGGEGQRGRGTQAQSRGGRRMAMYAEQSRFGRVCPGRRPARDTRTMSSGIPSGL